MKILVIFLLKKFSDRILIRVPLYLNFNVRKEKDCLYGKKCNK